MDRVGQALGWSAPVGADWLTRRRGPACASASCRGAFQGLTASAASPQGKPEPQASRSSSRNSRRSRKRRRSSSSSSSSSGTSSSTSCVGVYGRSHQTASGTSKRAHGVSGDVPEHPPSAKTEANLAKKVEKSGPRGPRRGCRPKGFSRKPKEGLCQFLGSAPGRKLEPCWAPKTRPREAEIGKK